MTADELYRKLETLFDADVWWVADGAEGIRTINFEVEEVEEDEDDEH